MILARCPACATRFRVTAEQLRLRGGRVRCGRCRHAFNALDHLVEPSATPGEASSIEAPEARAIPAPAEETLVEAEAAESSIEEQTPESPAEDELPPQAPLSAGVPHEAAAEPTAPGAVPASAALPDVQTEGEDQTPAAIRSARKDVREETAPPAQAAPAARRRPTRAAWGAGIALASALLLAQAVYLFRAQLAQQVPSLRPALEAACLQLGCRVPLPRQGDLVSVEASELHPDPRDRNRLLLTAMVRNRAAFRQDYPHLEITLTDTRDQAVVRRVLAPEQYLTPDADPAGFAPQSELVLNLTMEARGAPASGYRLYVFYP